MAEQLGRSFDGDGVLFTRYPLPIQLGALKDAFLNPKDMYLPPQEIPPYERIPYEIPHSLKEPINELAHKLRIVFPDVRRVFHELGPTEKPSNFLNSGRPYTEKFIHITKTTLGKGGILPYFQDVMLKPDGLTTTESKIAGILEIIKKYGFKFVEHYDDNPRDGFRIAAFFLQRNMNVSVVIVQDASAGLLFSRRELIAHPNVSRAINLREGVFGAPKSSVDLQ